MSEEHPLEELVDLVVSDVVYPGRGLARLGELVVFVPGVVGGEQVRARITSRHKNFAEAELLEVVTPSPSRMEPECPLARRPLSGATAGQPICPGCSYQQMDYAEELRLKDAQLTNLIERLGGGPPEGEHLAPAAAPSPLRYRNKLVLHASAEGAPRSLGYVSEDNQTLVPVSDCPLARPEIAEGLHALLQDADFLSGLRERARVTLRFTETDGVRHWTGDDPQTRGWMTETTVVGPIRVSAAGFFQVHIAMADRLITAVQEIITRIQPAAVVDLYCGCGVFSVAAAGTGVPAVLGIDLDRRAIDAARHNARERGLRGVEFVSSTAATTIEQALTPVAPASTLLIVDPPRRGLEKQVTATIAGRGPGHVAYISCSPDTLARDLKILRAAGYAIASRQVFDMFPRTAHFESLVLLHRG